MNLQDDPDDDLDEDDDEDAPGADDEDDGEDDDDDDEDDVETWQVRKGTGGNLQKQLDFRERPARLARISQLS
jgi:hypothetical protein